MHTDRFRLFREPFDSLNLSVPILLLLGALTEILFFRGGLTAYSNHIQFLQDFVFFSQLHPAMTYVLLASTVSGRQICQDFLVKFGWGGVARLAFVFTGSAFGYFLLARNVEPQHILYSLFALTFIGARDHHKISQIKGLIRIANAHPKEPETSDWIKRWEPRLIMTFLLPSVAVQFVFFDKSLPWGDWQQPVFKGVFIFSVIFATGLVLLGLISPSRIRAWKAAFSLRHFCKILSPYSVLANFGSGAVHGVEYLGVVDSIVEQDRRKSRSMVSVLFVVLFGLIMIPYAVMTRPEFFLGHDTVDKLYVDILLSLAVGFGWTHFLMDHFLFSPKYGIGLPFLKSIDSFANEAHATRALLPTLAKSERFKNAN